MLLYVARHTQNTFPQNDEYSLSPYALSVATTSQDIEFIIIIIIIEIVVAGMNTNPGGVPT